MKKLLVALTMFVLVLISGQAYAVGTASVTSVQDLYVIGQKSKIILIITWVDDTAGTTLAINPSTYGITGWYLYSGETNPGSTAPTAAYDITLIDADGVDIAGSMLINRSATTTELVNIGTAATGYPVIRSAFTFTLSGNSNAKATGTLILIFIAN